MKKKYINYLSFAHFLSNVAGDEIIKNYKKKKLKSSKKVIENKFELVTKVDLNIEKKIRSIIKKYYPMHNIIGEEFKNEIKNSDYCWIIDPIDGTKAFSVGIPVFGFLISLNYKNNNVLGMIDLPILRERFWNYENRAYLNGKSIKTRKCYKISDAIVASTEPNMFKNFNCISKKLFNKFNYMRWGTDIIGYLRCSEGLVDAVIERNIKIWDIAAVDPIIKAAGGNITTWEGKPIGTDDTVCAAGDKSLHTKLLKSLQKFI